MGPILRWLLLLTVAIACVAPASAPAQVAGPRTRVLIVSALPPGAPALGAFSEALREAMRTELAVPVEFYEEPLDLDRFPQRARDAVLDRYFAEKYRGHHIDVIIAVQTVSLRLVTARLSRLFPGVPIVYGLAVEPMADSVASTTYVVGRMVRLPFAETFALARAMQPDAERVVVVGGVSAADSVAVERAVRDLEPLRGGLPLVVVRGLSYDSLLVALRRVPPRSIVLLAHFRRDARGQAFILPEITASLARASAAPVYGVYDVLVGRGIVGGAVVAMADEGARTGRLAARVLRRRPGDDIPPVDSAGFAMVVDWRALQRWGMSASAVPPGTAVLFRTPTAWERYRVQILLALGLIAVETLLIGRLLRERRERRGMQRQVEDQARYERTIAELTTDAVRHAPDEAPRALEDAVARLARYAGASRALLVRYADGASEPATVLAWTGAPADGHGGNGSRGHADADGATPRAAASRLEIPLVADGRALGAIRLHAGDGVTWTPEAVSRLRAAGEIIAGAIARARAAEVIREEEELNRAVLASHSTNIAIVDREGVIVRVNDGWRAQARHGGVEAARDAFVGASYLDECRRAEARGCGEAGEVAAGIEAVLHGEARAFRREYRLAPTEDRWWEVSVDRLATPDGGAVVSHLDVTERRLADLRAEESQRQLAHMGRVAIVGELTASLSHELRQPLFVVRTNARLALAALEKAPADEEVLDVLRDIAAAERRATDVIDSIRAMLRKEETRAPVELNALCRQAVRLVRRDAEHRRVRVDLELGSHALVVSADAVQLQQVLVNLLLNAFEATAGTDAVRRVLVGAASRTGEAELFVRDTGPGLPHGMRERLFESFYTTKAHGLGMGLSIVRSIVERHGGTVWAEDAPGGGALFRVLLPLLP